MLLIVTKRSSGFSFSLEGSLIGDSLRFTSETGFRSSIGVDSSKLPGGGRAIGVVNRIFACGLSLRSVSDCKRRFEGFLERSAVADEKGVIAGRIKGVANWCCSIFLYGVSMSGAFNDSEAVKSTTSAFRTSGSTSF